MLPSHRCVWAISSYCSRRTGGWILCASPCATPSRRGEDDAAPVGGARLLVRNSPGAAREIHRGREAPGSGSTKAGRPGEVWASPQGGGVRERPFQAARLSGAERGGAHCVLAERNRWGRDGRCRRRWSGGWGRERLLCPARGTEPRGH